MKSPDEDPQSQQSASTIFIKDGKVLSGLAAEVYTKHRDGDIAQAVKGLFIIKGGGALGLLAFFKDVWNTQPSLARTILGSLTLLVVGAALAGAVHVVRYVASFCYQQGDSTAPTLRLTYIYLAICSFGAFIVAMIVMTVGMWLVLQPAPSS
jgi:hypothetical protein